MIVNGKPEFPGWNNQSTKDIWCQEFSKHLNKWSQGWTRYQRTDAYSFWVIKCYAFAHDQRSKV